MDYNKPIYAILNPERLKKLCYRLGIKESDLEVNFSGWGKLVYLLKDKVILFPRDPDYAKNLAIEGGVYEYFSKIDFGYAPKLIERIYDQSISYYEFFMVERASGVSFESIIEIDNTDQIVTFLKKVAAAIGDIHSLEIENLPELVKSKNILGDYPDFDEILMGEILKTEGDEKIHKILKEAFDILDQKLDGIVDVVQKEISKIRELGDVFLHYDLHSDQVFVDPETLEITKIIDWAGARIGNPIYDFNFIQWDYEIFADWNRLTLLRNEFWGEYLRIKGLDERLTSSCDVFYKVLELGIILHGKQKEKFGFTGKGFRESVEMYVNYFTNFSNEL